MTETLSAAHALVSRLQASGAELWVEAGALRFRAPRGVVDEASRNAIADQREAIIEILSAAARPAARAEPPSGRIAPLPPGREPPLSFAQRRLWFLDQLDPGAPQYNIGGALTIREPIDEAALRLAVDDLFARHDAFRTRIFTENGAPRLEIVAHAGIALEVIDLSAESGLDREATARSQGQDALRTRFDLAAGRLALMRLVRFAPDDSRLFFVAHHIIADGWSLDLVWADLGALYQARASGEAPRLPPLTLRYGDFAAWEQAQADADGFAQDVAFWREELRDAPVLLELPTDRTRPLTGGARGGRYGAVIEAALVEGLREVARSNGATLFAALLSVWQSLLARLSGQADLVVGTPVAARDDEALEKVVGCFINNIPLRGDLSGDPTFVELLERTRAVTLRAFRHRALPFEKIVEAVNPPRTAAYAPIFQTLFTLMNFRPEGTAAPTVQSSPIEGDTGGARFDLSLEISQAGPEGFLASYEYDAALFDESTVARMHAQYMRLLKAAIENPGAPLTATSLLSPEEAAVVAEAWNATDQAFDRAMTTSQAIAAVAGDRPDAVAVRAEDGSVTYAAFEARANQLARALAARGAGPGGRVGVCLGRGLDLPVALAAVWKTGAAYVPLDPNHPAERLGLVLEDADVACVATTSDLAGLLGETPVLLLDEEREAIAALDATPLQAAATPDSLAYLIYTSGSTGKPKGVEVSHAALAAFLEAMRREPGLGPGEALLAVTTPSFDIAGLELWLPLTVGGCVVIASAFDVVDGAALADLLEAHDVRLLQATPTTWRLLLEEGWGGKPDLKALCGGEALPLDLAKVLVGQVEALWNVYGPTETTIWSTTHRVSETDLELGRIPVGRPIANTRVYVLEPSGGLAAVGAPGELVIAGEGVARGYRNLPDLTADRFVEIAPLGRRQRAYRTGDLARWRANGVLDFIGRADGQVKIRGFRIELGEVEAALASHPAVRQVCVAVSNASGGAALVAYLVYEPGAEPTTSELRRYLRNRLPDYMTPALFIAIDAVPLSPSGKVDRRRLPDPFRAGKRANRSDEPLAPGLECVMGEIWRELLETDRVGPGDNFFELGGHSLLSVRVAAALQRRAGLTLDPRALFFQTLREVVAGIEQSRPEKG